MLAKNARAFQVKPALDVRSVTCRGVDGLTKIALKQMKLITTLFLRTQYVQVNSHVNPERAARFCEKFYNVVPKMQDDQVIF